MRLICRSQLSRTSFYYLKNYQNHHGNRVKLIFKQYLTPVAPACRASVPPESDGLLLDALLRDDPEGDGVSGVDLPLGGRDEEVVHQVDGLLQADVRLLRPNHVLLADLIRIQ